jgi:hypothetical protein
MSCLRSVPKELWKPFAECCERPLQHFVEASARDDPEEMFTSLKDFLELIPRLLAVPRGGRSNKTRKRNIAHIRNTLQAVRFEQQSEAGTCETNPSVSQTPPPARSFSELSAAEAARASSILRAVGLERAGHTSRAVRALDNIAMADPSESTAIEQDLANLHPSCDPPIARAPLAPFVAVPADDAFVKLWKSRIANGAAPGPSLRVTNYLSWRTLTA